MRTSPSASSVDFLAAVIAPGCYWQRIASTGLAAAYRQGDTPDSQSEKEYCHQAQPEHECYARCEQSMFRRYELAE